MFDTLGDRLQASLGDLRKRGRLDEETISKAMREIRLALLEADVNFKVVKEFVDRVKERALGQDVLKSLTPGQQVVKIVHEELTALMGSGSSKLAFAGKPPTVILLAGLQGSGKTTAAAKLALLLRKDGSAPALVAADLQRPAAVDQLEQLGRQIQVPVFTGPDPVKAAADGIEQAKAQGRDVVIVDTAGRLQIDEPLMEELAAVRKAAKPHNVLLVLDAMTGQEAVAVAEAFQERVAFDGVVLTKLDGDARGGAALVGQGGHRQADQACLGRREARPARVLPSRPDGLAHPRDGRRPEPDREGRGRDRGGRAGGDGSADPRRPVHVRRLPRGAEDAEAHGPAPGRAQADSRHREPAQGLDVDERQLARVEAIVLSMTPQERRMPHLINGSRRQRIARGSGTTVQQVNQLLSARKQMEKMMKQMGKGKLPKLPPQIAQQQGRR